jgi:DNA invertase Pin-like site-specific DNA recombinase
MHVGYARTSTFEQQAGLEAQLRQLWEQGCERVFAEQVSSVGRREQLQECLRFVREGDVLFVCKPDRLARSTAELLRTVEDLGQRGVGLVILSMGGSRLDTRQPTSMLLLTMLAAVAEFERGIMLERQREGIAKARAEGKYKGRAPTARRMVAKMQELKASGMRPAEIAVELRINRASVYRVLGEARPAPEGAPRSLGVGDALHVRGRYDSERRV